MSGEATATAVRGAEKLDKYLTFHLGDEIYGIEILKVREIIGLMMITRMPRMPEFVRGIINLRGKVIPVIDLRNRFGMESVDEDKETCIIVVDLAGVLTGIVVDRVSEVTNIPEADIEETPSFGVSVDTKFILGIGKAKDRVAILLDIMKVLSSEEIDSLSSLEKI